jgi:hypothetical protein
MAPADLVAKPAGYSLGKKTISDVGDTAENGTEQESEDSRIPEQIGVGRVPMPL